MTTAALNNLWNYIDSMMLSNRNKQWLADKLIESKTTSKREEQEKYVKESLERAFAEVREAKRTGQKLQTLDDFLNELD